MGEYQTVVLGPFRGLRQDKNPHHLDRNDLSIALNVSMWGRTVGTRPGANTFAALTEFENRLTSNVAVQGMTEWRIDRDATTRNLVVANVDAGSNKPEVWYEDGAQFGNATATLTEGDDNIWTFATHNDILFAAGGAAADDFWHLDPSNTANAPTEIVLPTLGGSTPRPSYVFSWRGYLLVNGFRGTTSADSNPTATRFCEFATDPTVAENWRSGNTIGFSANRKGIDAYGDNFATGFGTYQDNHGDWLLILGKKNIAAVKQDTTLQADFRVTDHIATGCESQRAFVSLGLDSGDAVYLSDKGIHSIRQSQEHGARADKFLSWKIQDLFNTLNRSRLKFAIGAYDFINGRVYFVVSTGSSTVHDVVLVLEVSAQEELTSESASWWEWRLDPTVKINDLKFMRDQSDVWRMWFGTTDGYVGFFDDDTNSDLGTPFTSAFVTSHHHYGSTLRDKRVGDVMVTLQPGGTYKPKFRMHFDYGSRLGKLIPMTMPKTGGFVLGTDVLGVGRLGSGEATRDEKVYARGSGRTLAFGVSHTGTNEPFRVASIHAQVMVGGEDTGDTSNAA